PDLPPAAALAAPGPAADPHPRGPGRRRCPRRARRGAGTGRAGRRAADAATDPSGCADPCATRPHRGAAGPAGPVPVGVAVRAAARDPVPRRPRPRPGAPARPGRRPRHAPALPDRRLGVPPGQPGDRRRHRSRLLRAAPRPHLHRHRDAVGTRPGRPGRIRTGLPRQHRHPRPHRAPGRTRPVTDMTSRYRAAWESARRRARQHQQTVRHLSQAVWVAPDRQGGTACVGGTRVSAALIASLLADGMTVEEIRDGYPSVTADGARAAEAFAARYVDRDQVAHNGCSQQHNEHPDDDLPTPEPLPCGATAPLHSGATATCNRPAGHDTHAADDGARWTEDPYRTGLASELRRLAKTYGYPAVAHALTEQILHTQEQK